MKRDLLFIKDFRPIHGCDGEIANLVDDDLSEIPAKGGVYIIPQTKFVYPKGMSKVIYIGKANSIRRKLKEHQVNLRNTINDIQDKWWRFDRYNYMKYHGSKVYYYLCQSKQASKDLESYIWGIFYDKFGTMPVGNGAISFQCEITEGEE